MHGETWEDLIIEVPVGTLITDRDDGGTIFDFTRAWEEYTLCEWGRWGFWNAHFPSSTRQAPNFAELGDSWDVKDVTMELKLVADVGIVGLPNAGKSTVIQSLTNVRPKIADYAFTTLIPNLGVMEWKGRALVIEDVPGLIEWASTGKWLGFQFLKHIDRCRVIIHLLDASAWEEALVENYKIIENELKTWRDTHASFEWARERKEIIVFSKTDICDAEMVEEMASYFEKKTGKKVALSMSAGAYIRVDELKDLLIREIPENEDVTPLIDEKKPKVYDLKRQSDPKHVRITKREDGDFDVTGERIEEIARMTDLRYADGINRIYDVMEKLSVIKKIKSMVTSEMNEWRMWFFEWEDDIPSPNVWISGKKFSLENIIFMKWD